MANTITYQTLFESVLQERLARPTNWEEICKVDRTDTRVISSSYISTTGGWAAVQTITRGSTAVPVDIAETAETLTISTGRDVSTGNAATTIGADGLFEAKYSLKKAYRQTAEWMFSRTAVKQIAKLKKMHRIQNRIRS